MNNDNLSEECKKILKIHFVNIVFPPFTAKNSESFPHVINSKVLHIQFPISLTFSLIKSSLLCQSVVRVAVGHLSLHSVFLKRKFIVKLLVYLHLSCLLFGTIVCINMSASYLYLQFKLVFIVPYILMNHDYL